LVCRLQVVLVLRVLVLLLLQKVLLQAPLVPLQLLHLPPHLIQW
jgi:hypothetical protein